jgi:hypothetical protein
MGGGHGKLEGRVEDIVPVSAGTYNGEGTLVVIARDRRGQGECGCCQAVAITVWKYGI